MVFSEAVGYCFLLCILVNMTVQLFTEQYTVVFVKNQFPDPVNHSVILPFLPSLQLYVVYSNIF